MENWTHEWFFLVGALIVVIAMYVKRDKVKAFLGGGKPPGDGRQPRK